MAKVNICLKRSFITVASLTGIIGGLLLAITLLGHTELHRTDETQENLYGLYGISIVTLLLAIIGIFGAYKKKKWALILFAVGMILSSLFLIAFEVYEQVKKPEHVKELKEIYLDMLLLTNANEHLKDYIDADQMDLQCCGLDQGYMDWGYDIPESCICTEESTNPCVAAPRDSALFDYRTNDWPIMIYKEPCLPYLIEKEMRFTNIILGVMLGIALLWVLSVVLSILILCRLNQKEDTPAVVYSGEARADNYTTSLEQPA